MNDSNYEIYMRKDLESLARILAPSMPAGDFPAFQRQVDLPVRDVSAFVSDVGFTIEGRGARFSYGPLPSPFFRVGVGINKESQPAVDFGDFGDFGFIPRHKSLRKREEFFSLPAKLSRTPRHEKISLKTPRYENISSFEKNDFGLEWRAGYAPKMSINLADLEAMTGNSHLTITGEPNVEMTTVYSPPLCFGQGDIRVVRAWFAGDNIGMLLRGYKHKTGVSMPLARQAAQGALVDLHIDDVYKAFEGEARKRLADEAREKVSPGDETLIRYLGR